MPITTLVDILRTLMLIHMCRDDARRELIEALDSVGFPNVAMLSLSKRRTAKADEI